MNEKDLPQPGLEESDEERKNTSDQPPDGSGSPSVDEPTQPVLEPDEEVS